MLIIIEPKGKVYGQQQYSYNSYSLKFFTIKVGEGIKEWIKD